MHARDRPAGFTLVEVMVALALGAAVLLAARLVLGGVSLGADRITASRARADRETIPEAELRALLRRIEVGTDSTRTFEGGELGARFTSWCDVPGGWQERCTAQLLVDARGDTTVARFGTSTGEVHVLRAGFAFGAIRYLRDAADGGTWLPRWGRSLSAPEAILLMVDGDSLILRIGERG